MSASPRALAVYCGSYSGNKKAYFNAGQSLGKALARSDYRLVYGGGSSGIMGAVSSATLEAGGKVTGVRPYAMVRAGGEGEKAAASELANNDRLEEIVVDSMHARKVEMARLSRGFIGLPGGFGTFEEVMEVTTWTQIGIHTKPVVLLNVLGFYEPLRQLIQGGIEAGFITPKNKDLITFIDGPESHAEHEDYDWGAAGVNAIDNWKGGIAPPLFDWSENQDGTRVETLAST
ncbi:hypothetical protein C8J56DRAFT_960237 [Mycena floridula]|nr:hypothetical protein C8J56DRAFT_960237 [Mycena floridula]